MRLVVVVPHFPPDTAPTGVVAGRWVEGLADRGHHVDVVTTLPSYREHRVEEAWRGRPVRVEATSWGRVVRVHPLVRGDKTDVLARAVALVGSTVLTAVAALATRDRPDAVIAMSPPLTSAAVGRLVAGRARPLVFNVQDLYPDAAERLGILGPGRVLNGFRRLERASYRWADAVTVLSEDLAEVVRERADDPAKVRVVPNFADAGRIAPGPTDNAYRREHDLTGRTVVMYAGNVGLSQPLDLLVELARRHPELTVVVNGSGGGLDALRRSAGDLDNVRFVPPQPEDRLAEVLAAADVHVVPLRRGLARASVPSKLYSVLAAGRPVVASVDAGTEVARVVERAGAGVAVAPEDADALEAGVLAVLDRPDRGRGAGEAGRAWATAWLTPDGVAAEYERLAADLMAARAGRRSEPVSQR